MSNVCSCSDSVPVCNIQPKATNKRSKTSKASPNKYINNVDGLGNYLRFVFTSKTLEEANSVLHDLYQDHIIDYSYVHSYSRHKKLEGGDSLYFSNHGIARVVHPSANFNYFRNRYPKMSFKLSFYPDREYPQTNRKSQEPKHFTDVLQTGQVLSNQTYDSCFNSNVTGCPSDAGNSLLVY